MPIQAENFEVNGIPIPVADTQAREDIVTLNASLAQKQDKIKTTSFSGTTDTNGNIALQGVTVASNIILSVVSINGYCTQVVPSGNDWYVKILGNTNPVQPLASTNTTIYVSYV